MDCICLKYLDDSQTETIIDILDDEDVTLGRGQFGVSLLFPFLFRLPLKFLQMTDKRISRTHANISLMSHQVYLKTVSFFLHSYSLFGNCVSFRPV